MRTGSAQTISPLLRGIDQARRPTGPVLAFLVVVVSLLLGQLIGGLVFAAALGVAPERFLRLDFGLAEQLAFTLSFLFVLLSLVLWIRFKERRSLVSVGFHRQEAGRSVLLGFVVASVLMTIPTLLNVLFGQFEVVGYTADAARIGAVLLVLGGFVVQASTEEVLTRGYLMQAVHRKWGLLAAVAIQAAVFTALHGVNAGVGLIPVLNLLLISVLLGFWALAEGGLWGVCAFHAVWNWVQGNVYGIEVSGLNLGVTWLDVDARTGGAEPLTGGAFGIEGSVLTTVLLGIGSVVAMLAFRRRQRAGWPKYAPNALGGDASQQR